MLGEKQRSEPMFNYMTIEDMIPENHLLRMVDKHIDIRFIREKVKHLYSHPGRPSIDLEILLRMLLIGYLYGITSERCLCEGIGVLAAVLFHPPDHVPDPEPRNHLYKRVDAETEKLCD